MLKNIFLVVLFLAFIGLGFGLYITYAKVETLSEQIGALQLNQASPSLSDNGSNIVEKIQKASDSGYTKSQVDELISKAIATIPKSSGKTVIEKQTVVQKSSGVDYIPMGGTVSTTSMDWEDVDDSIVYIDLIDDYGENATVSLEASLKVAHGNGKAFARLWDDTNKIAVDLSEITTTDNVDFIRVSSGNLPFWRGRNLYKIQLKSLNSFEITYSGGKIKVDY